MGYTNKGSPSKWLAGKSCVAKWTAAWKSTMQYAAMRTAAAKAALNCMRALSDSRSRTICAVCDNTNESKFKGGKLNVRPDNLKAIATACAPFVEFVAGFQQVGLAVAEYAAAVNPDSAQYVNAFQTAKDVFSSEVDGCFSSAKATTNPTKDNSAAPAKKDDKKPAASDKKAEKKDAAAEKKDAAAEKKAEKKDAEKGRILQAPTKKPAAKPA